MRDVQNVVVFDHCDTVVAAQTGKLYGNYGGQMTGLTIREENGTETYNGKFSTNDDLLCVARGILIRPYEKKDRDAVRRICCDTGVWGNPVETLFNDREIFADLFTGPYLDYEPEWALIAEDEGRVIGYLLGSVCPNFDFVQMRSGLQTTVKMLGRFAIGRYANHPRSRRFIRWLLTSGYWEQPKHPAKAAHLHLDIEKSYRGHGIGWMLWRTYEKKLKAAGIHQCYGAFFSHPKRQPELAYSRFGFSVFDRKRTTLFEPEISDPVEVVCVQKMLQPIAIMNGHNGNGYNGNGHNGHNGHDLSGNGNRNGK